MPKKKTGARRRRSTGADSGGQLYEVKDGRLRLNLHPGQSKAWDSDKRFVFVLAGTQSGKSIYVNTDIPTPGGWAKMGDIKVGDQVFAEDGAPCNVTFVSSVMHNRDCYLITFDDGSEIVADGDHQWVTRTAEQRGKYDKYIKYTCTLRKRHGPRTPHSSIVTTKEIQKTLLRNGSSGQSNHSIDLPLAAQYSERDLPLPPYFFGVWLGDGSSRQSIITCAKVDEEIIDECKRDGIAFSSIRQHSNADTTFHYYASRYNGRCVRTILIEMGVLRDKRNEDSRKYIPDEYMLSSVEQRAELLKGLLDSDGSCRKNGHVRFAQKDGSLAYQVLELARSLGIKSKMRIRKRTGKDREYGPAHIVSMHSEIPLFRLTRKLNRQMGTRRNPRTARRYIRSIESVDSVPVKCIQVDSKSSLYLAGRDYIPTHNTSFAPWWVHNELMNTWSPGGNNDYLAVTSSFDLFKLKFLPEMTKVFCDVLDIGRWHASDRMIEIKCLDPDDPRYMQFYANTANDPMWARIVLRSAQSEGGLESTTAKAAVLDECGQPGFSLQSWEAINRRLSITQGRILGITTPYNLGWIYTNIYLPWLNGDPDIDIIQFSSHMNPMFPMAEYERAKKKLPDWRFAMFYDGQFRRPAGLIYQEFNEISMTCEPFDIPPDWEHVVGVDFGGANNATVWLARNPEDNRWYLYRESLLGHRSTADHVSDALELSAGITDLTAVGGAAGETQQRTDWDAEGFPIDEPPVFDLEAGISRVTSLIKSDRLRVFRDLRGVLNDLGGYRRKLDESGEPTEDIVFKKRFHFADALRYACTWIEDEGGTDVLGYVDFRKRYKQ